MALNSNMEVLEAQIRELFGRTVWTHKTQEKCADILNARNHTIKIIQIVLSALTTTGILITVFGDNDVVGIISAIISTTLLILTTYIKNYNLGQIAQKHSDAAIKLWNIREKYLSLLTDIKINAMTEAQIREQRDILQKELFTVYKGAERTINKAYDEASKALKQNEELTFSDEEIDNFLPDKLRKGGK
ncbi:SLATT domain-containing protein [Candidatus Sulfurimonas baltica]|uniref:SLATT domain-containing protein n=1 Tax=Candidatus Sulfurimonas baltica TaxID=2740404 RepID=A0A7S7LWM8_9BACT|nr:SLATT domain-containing protein [Candidatus Sulfurimonas baltica]QOY52731.1 SLATT domain-containing protein [Candidatus Sulfurimonas baltica]